MSNIKNEFELYEGMCLWLKTYLNDKYRKNNCTIAVVDCHSIYLNKVLERYGIIKYYPQVIGLNIEIDVLGMAIWDNKAEIYFIEAKKMELTLQNLGQLIVYCKLCNPEEAFLLSPMGLGSLEKVLNILKREDLLNYSEEKKIKKIKVAKWDISRNTIDNHTILPKL